MTWWNPATWFQRKAITSADLGVLLGSSSTASGVSVTWATALQATTVLACARAISDGLSQVPFRVMLTDGVSRDPAVNHPLYPLIEWAPNEWQSPTEMMDQLGLHLVLTGNAYVWLNRSRGRIVEMLPWRPDAVSVSRDGMAPTYTLVLENGRTQDVPAADMWHIRGPSWDGLLGMDVVKLAREAIGLSLTAERQVAATMANGSRLGGILTTDANLSSEQRASLRAAWQETQAGAGNSGRIAVMSNGFKFQPMTSTAVDAQELENRKFQVEEVCRAMRVLPALIGASDKATTYASAEAMFQAHVTHTLAPWYQRIERSANKALLTEDERRSGHYFKFFPQGLLRGNSQARAAFYTALYNIGAMNPNEIRALEDLNPYPEGAQFRVPLNMEDPADPEPERDSPKDGQDEPT